MIEALTLWCTFYLLEIKPAFGPWLKDLQRAEVRLEDRTFWEWEDIFCAKKMGSPISRNDHGGVGSVLDTGTAARVPRGHGSGG